MDALELELPDDGPLSEGQRRAIRDNAAAMISADARLSRAALAKRLSVSRSVLGETLDGTYRGDADRVLRKLHQWMLAEAGRTDRPAVGYAPTSIGRLCMAVCRRAASLGKLGKIVAPAGAGKTIALREFARAHGDRAVYLRATPAGRSTGAFLRQLAARLGLARRRCTIDEMAQAVTDKLRELTGDGGSARIVLLIDEAHTLSPEAKHEVRALCDEPACGTVAVFADTARLERELGSRDGRIMYEQLNRRTTNCFVMGADEAVDAADVRAVAESTLRDIGRAGARLTAASLAYLTRDAQRDGKLANVAERLVNAADMARAADVEPVFSPAELDWVSDVLGVAPAHPEWKADPFDRPADADDDNVNEASSQRSQRTLRMA